MANDVFTKHQHDPVPLHRNTMPVAECGVHSATVGGKPCKAIDVPILSCASVWLRVQKEAEAWITIGGKLIEDRIRRNRQINQAYAQLWQADRRFQWAGLAAFASKQVGCGLLHAADNIKKAQEEMRVNHFRTDIMNSSDGAAIDIMPSGISGSSAYMHEQLALGNTLLFLDIYPLHRFYMLRGLAHMQQCLDQRRKIECRSQSSSLNILFSKNKTAKLYNQDQPMAFVYEAATRFDSLLHSNSRSSIEASIGEIAKSGGR
jgi:hypothetical protein